MTRTAAVLVLASLLTPLPAAAQPAPMAVCWFYTYVWAVQYVVPNVSPLTTFAKRGEGTGLLVTDGRQPSDQEVAVLTDRLTSRLPRGDLDAPPPVARVSGMAKVPCPPRIAQLSADVARAILGQ